VSMSPRARVFLPNTPGESSHVEDLAQYGGDGPGG
jgi:hypothetical protein